MGHETENKQVNLFMKKPDGSYVYMCPVPEIKFINGVPIPTVTNEKEATNMASITFSNEKDTFLELNLDDEYLYKQPAPGNEFTFEEIYAKWTNMKKLSEDLVRRQQYTPKKIIQNGPAFIVFWSDGTKTVLMRKDGDQDDPYAAFGQALMRKIFGNNSHAHKIVDRVIHYRDMEVVE